MSDKKGSHTHACGCERSFGAGMAAADDDDIELVWMGVSDSCHGGFFGGLRGQKERNYRVLHVPVMGCDDA